MRSRTRTRALARPDRGPEEVGRPERLAAARPSDRALERRQPRQVVGIERLRRCARPGNEDSKFVRRVRELEDATAVQGDVDVRTLAETREKIGIGIARLMPPPTTRRSTVRITGPANG